MNLAHLFDLSLQGRRQEIAVEFEDRTFTFADIDSRSNRLAGLLAQRGVARGDRLCVYLANCVELIDLFLACVKLGVIFVPVNILYRGREIAHILSDAEPVAIVSDQQLDAAVPVWNPADLTAEAANLPDRRPAAVLDGDAPAGIIYTSGTTGASKGAILTHNNFAANAITLLTCWQITSGDRFLLALPLFHVHGLGNGLCCWLASGCRMRLLRRFEHQTAAATFLDFKPTLFFGVPTIYVRMLDIPQDQAREIGRAMRLFVSGSAPLPGHVFKAFRQRFGHAILERYGMSETLMNISNPYIGERRPGTVGIPLPGISVRIVNGEIELQGPNLFAGYWRREPQQGWFRTGDLAEVSDDGYFTLRGRRSDLIISGGFNIYPREIEEFLMEQPEVVEAAVIGVADPVRGEVPVACVVLREPADLAARCREQLASFKVPREFRTIEKLPRNAMGKVQKHLL
jgi:malonyl-CoA/methylmalonyl-CoA synthetase